MKTFFAIVLGVLVSSAMFHPVAAQDNFQLAPAVALEAEDFVVDKGWQVIKNGDGNYMQDIIGFQHISGERLLGVDEKDSTASAHSDITVPKDVDYRLWVRYEYPAFSEVRFRVTVEQNGKTLTDTVMGAKDNPRLGFGDPTFKAQHDPSWGSEGLFEEVVAVKGLKAGKARIYLKSADQPQIPGRAARRNIDLLYLTSDVADAWLPHYKQRNNFYPILDAFRDTVGPRYEVRFTNRGTKPGSYTVARQYNRNPYWWNVPQLAKDVAPGATSEWAPIPDQDTAHFTTVLISSTSGTGTSPLPG